MTPVDRDFRRIGASVRNGLWALNVLSWRSTAECCLNFQTGGAMAEETIYERTELGSVERLIVRDTGTVTWSHTFPDEDGSRLQPMSLSVGIQEAMRLWPGSRRQIEEAFARLSPKAKSPGSR